MGFAVISLVIGLFLFGYGFSMEVSNVAQQAVRYMMYICASIFSVGSFICFGLASIKSALKPEISQANDDEKQNNNSTVDEGKVEHIKTEDKKNVEDSFWICNRCNNKNPLRENYCQKCGSWKATSMKI